MASNVRSASSGGVVLWQTTPIRGSPNGAGRLGVRHDGVIVQIADDALDFDVIRPANDQDEIAVALQFLRGVMHAADQRAGRVDQILSGIDQVSALVLADAVGGDDDGLRERQRPSAVLRVHGETTQSQRF